VCFTTKPRVSAGDLGSARARVFDTSVPTDVYKVTTATGSTGTRTPAVTTLSTAGAADKCAVSGGAAGTCTAVQVGAFNCLATTGRVFSPADARSAVTTTSATAATTVKPGSFGRVTYVDTAG